MFDFAISKPRDSKKASRMALQWMQQDQMAEALPATVKQFSTYLRLMNSKVRLAGVPFFYPSPDSKAGLHE